MSSRALQSLLIALEEVGDLQRANPTPTGAAPSQPETTRAIGRASVVLLSSHLERYIRNLNEEAVEFVNSAGVIGPSLPESLRLLHSKGSVDDLYRTNWEIQARATMLMTFAQADMWLWVPGGTGHLQQARLLTWMRTPMPVEIQRYFRYWEIRDIFSAVTRKAHTRSHFWLKVEELVTKRNNIAHGDLLTEATQEDVQAYVEVVKELCQRIDRQFSRRLGRLLVTTSPW
jgi:hypothetical protein